MSHAHKGCEQAYRDACCTSKGSRQKRRRDRPLYAFRLLVRSNQRSRTWPVHQREEQRTASSDRSPTVCRKHLSYAEQGISVVQAILGQIDHQRYGKYRLVGRPAENKSQQDNTVHTEKPSQRVNRPGSQTKQVLSADAYICQTPQQQSGRRRHGSRTPEDEQSPFL